MEALGTTLGECIVLEAVCVHHLCLLHVFANTDEGTQTRTRSTHSVHINPQTHIPRLIPLQLRPIRARVKGSLRGGGKDRRVRVLYIPHHLFSLVCRHRV